MYTLALSCYGIDATKFSKLLRITQLNIVAYIGHAIWGDSFYTHQKVD